jgi:hypothetical protein
MSENSFWLPSTNSLGILENLKVYTIYARALQRNKGMSYIYNIYFMGAVSISAG